MKEHIAHSGAWGITLIVIAVASWFLYRYLAPKTWKEWASAGVIQAFIIALYAEMYGFPLTIYLLVRLDRTYLNANLWSTLLGFGETGKDDLNDRRLLDPVRRPWDIHGRVARTASDPKGKPARHGRPLRAGAAPPIHRAFHRAFRRGHHWPTIFSVALFPIIVLVYVLLARSEERKVVEEFGDEYLAYRRRVPMFIPRWGQWPKLLTMRNSTPEAGDESCLKGKGTESRNQTTTTKKEA